MLKKMSLEKISDEKFACDISVAESIHEPETADDKSKSISTSLIPAPSASRTNISQCADTQANISNNSNNSEPLSNTPLLSLASKKMELLLPAISSHPSSASFCLSDSVSVISAEELMQRREALKIFSSEQSVVLSASRSLSLLPNMVINYELTPFSSTISSLSPLCRICQCCAEADNVLINPCRCDGSLKYIHATCLLVSILFS